MTTVKKTHWLRITLIVLIACGIIGMIWAVIQFNTESGDVSASVSIQFSFNGAAEGKAPNGYPFDVSGITSDEVLSEALISAGLQDTYTADQIRQSLTVTGVYPEKILEQMITYVSLLDKNADIQAPVSDYYATEYRIVLRNLFDKGISQSALTDLLSRIMESYRAYFARVYSTNPIEGYSVEMLEPYDYIQQLDLLGETVKQQQRYAEEMSEQASGFSLNGTSFGDIAVRYQGLDNDIDRVKSEITSNVVSKDRERLLKSYEFGIRSKNEELEGLNLKLKQVEEQVDTYEKEGAIYISENGTLQKLGGNTNNTYDKLVTKRKEIVENIAEVKAVIAQYRTRLDEMTKETTAAEETAAAEEENTETATATVDQPTEEVYAQRKTAADQSIQTLLGKAEVAANDFGVLMKEYYAQEINNSTVSVSNIRYYAPSIISSAFVIKLLRTAGPLCAVGFMVCMVLLIISRRREEKQAAA